MAAAPVAPVAALVAALGLLATGCGRYVPGTIAPSARATLGAAFDGDAAVAPDGKHVAFVSERADGRRELFLLPSWAAGQADPAHVSAESLTSDAFDIARPTWSRDGHTLRYTRIDPTDGSARVWEVGLEAGSPHRHTLLPLGGPNGAAVNAVEAPDGSGTLAVVVRGDSTWALGTWTQSGGFRALVALPSGAEANDPLPRPTWHGRRADGLAYAQGGALWWVSRAGGAPVRLTGGHARADQPAFSPDGKWLCFVSDTTSVSNVWLARFTLEGKLRAPKLGAWRPVSASFQPVGHPAWTPDGHALWFERQDPWVIVARDANLPGQGSAGAPPGSPDTLSSSLFDCRSPSFSGDGTHVAFASTRSGPWHVFAMSAAGEAGSGPGKELTYGAGGCTEPRWSRASGQIAYVRGGDTLSLTDPVGAVLGDLGTGRSPAWSPDGRSLAFVDPAGTLSAIEGIGRTRRALTGAGMHAWDPWWGTGALDGFLVFGGSGMAGMATPHLPLSRVPVTGGRREPITTDNVLGSVDSEPAVSPDGRWIVFTRQRRGDRDLWLLDTTAGDARPLVTNFRGQDGHAEWSPDGRRIVYETGGAVNLYRADVRPLLLR